MSRFRSVYLASIAPLAFFFACSSEDSTSTAAAGDGGTEEAASPRDGSSPGDDDARASDANDTKDAGADAAKTGETCIGYGKGESCDGGVPPYGYVCFGGAPPGFTGCVETRSSAAIGNNYCCPKNDCVAQPDQDKQCNGVSGKPHRFQCPPGDDGGTVAAPSGCVEHGSGSTALEKFYCCPP